MYINKILTQKDGYGNKEQHSQQKLSTKKQKKSISQQSNDTHKMQILI